MSEPHADHPAPDALAAFRVGRLSDAGSAAVAAHLEVCPACRQAVENAGRRSYPAGIARQARRSGTLVPGTPLPAPADLPSGRFRLPASGTMLPGGPPPAPPPVPPGGSGTRIPGTPLPAPADLPPELASHPRYRVTRELGRGGMGTVYQAEQVVMHRQVAIKVISPSLLEHPDALERFNREVQAAAKLSHPNIVTAHDAEQAGGLHMLVMEYVEGQSLDRVLQKKGPLAVAHACHFARQAALGLQHAHEQGMVHRDIKPQNLMLTPKGRVKILDFGLAKAASERGRGKGLTAVNSYMGTPEYSAPEQAADARSADIRADIYSLGCTLYALLAGHPPFQEDTDVKTILAHLEREPVPLTELRPDVPAELWDVVAKMMAKDPAQRFQTPAEVAQALVPFCKPGGKTAGTPTRLPAAERGVSTKEGLRGGQTKEPAFEFGGRVEGPPGRQAGAGPRKPGGLRVPLLIAGGAALAVVLVAVVLGVVLRSKTRAGTLVVEVDQPGAEVCVDGQRYTITRPGDEPIQVEVQQGTRQLKVVKGGFETFTREFTVKAGGKETIRVRLEPVAVSSTDAQPRPGGQAEEKPKQNEVPQNTAAKPADQATAAPRPPNKQPDGAEDKITSKTTPTKEPTSTEPAKGPNPVVLMHTSLGDIRLELFADKAPKTVANFLAYVDEGFYDGTIFSLVGLKSTASNFALLGGGYEPGGREKKPTRPPVASESDNGLSNVAGTAAMFRAGGADTATTQFLINISDNGSILDRGGARDGVGYCVFGRVVGGMEVMNRIQAVITVNRKGSKIISIRRDSSGGR